MQGISFVKASPLAQATPILTPVYDPGPVTQAIRSISSSETPDKSMAFFTTFIRVFEWVKPLLANTSDIILPSAATAALAATEEESIERIFNLCASVNSDYSLVFVFTRFKINSDRVFGQSVFDVFAPFNGENAAADIIKKTGRI